MIKRPMPASQFIKSIISAGLQQESIYLLSISMQQ
jgi:hypothetical protein